jgi:hypothetical protein
MENKKSEKGSICCQCRAMQKIKTRNRNRNIYAGKKRKPPHITAIINYSTSSIH